MVALAIVGAPMASAQVATNEGVAEVVTAIDGLKPDLSFVVVAAIGLALIAMGAVIAVRIFRRLAGA